MYIFNALAPVVLICLLGYLARQRNWLGEAEAAAIERLSFWFLIPCLLFRGAATAQFPADMHWNYLLGFYGILTVVYLIGMALGRWWFGYDLRELSIYGMGGAYANATVLGIPITVAVLGQDALVPMLVIICVHNLLIFAFGTALAEWAQPSRTDEVGAATAWQSSPTSLAKLWRVCTEVLINPISGSLLAGALYNLLRLPLPKPLDATLQLLAGAAIPGSVFGLGTALTRYRIRGEIVRALVMTLLKLVVMPGLMWLVMIKLFAVDHLWAQAAVMIAAMPVGISVYIFARRYDRCETVAATAIVLSSLLSVVTLGFWVWWLAPS
ncbi:MAG TPA: AEC family transporter [Candidatus Acidoferrum sp.]|nr:AEC family transporter [Candidatus Acidoferrum sp.]